MDKYTSKYIPEWKLYILEYILLLTENKFRKENLWIETSILSRVVKYPWLPKKRDSPSFIAK